MTHPRVLVIGAGPTGCEAALAVAEAGWPVTLVEAGAAVGEHVRQWGHVRLFTPWSMNASPRVRRLLGSQVPDGADCPTGEELVAGLLEPVAAEVAARGGEVLTGTRVVGVSRTGLVKSDEIGTGARAGRPFRVLTDGPDGEQVRTADIVIDTTGTWAHPNPTGDGGLPALGERAVGDLVVRTIPGPAETAALADKAVLLVGAGYSAQTAARDLAAAGVAVTWAVRAAVPTFGAVVGDALPSRAALSDSAAAGLAGDVPGLEVRTGVVVEELRRTDDGRCSVTLRERTGTDQQTVTVDRVVSLTGAVGDASLYRELQVHECYATAAPMNLSAALLGAAGGDCLAQESHGVDVLRSPEPDFFILGSKSYGRNNQFLLRVGWEQVDEVVGALLAEHAARGAAA